VHVCGHDGVGDWAGGSCPIISFELCIFADEVSLHFHVLQRCEVGHRFRNFNIREGQRGAF